MGMRGQVQTMSRTGCLVSNGFIPSLSICVFISTSVKMGPEPGQLHLSWSLSSFPPPPPARHPPPPTCLPACPPRSSHQRVPVSTFLRSSRSSALTHLHPQCSFLRVRPLFLTLAYIALQDLLLSLPLPSLSLSPHGCFSNTPGKVLLPGLCMDCSLSWDHSQTRHQMASSLLPPALCSNAAFPWGL